MIVLEGTAIQLGPDFSLMPLLMARKESFARHAFSKEKLIQLSMRYYRDWAKLVSILPGTLTQMAQGMKHGTQENRIEVNRLDAMVNRLSQSILCAALFLGFSWVLSAKVPPHITHFSLLGAGGMTIAGVLGFH